MCYLNYTTRVGVYTSLLLTQSPSQSNCRQSFEWLIRNLFVVTGTAFCSQWFLKFLSNQAKNANS